MDHQANSDQWQIQDLPGGTMAIASLNVGLKAFVHFYKKVTKS